MRFWAAFFILFLAPEVGFRNASLALFLCLWKIADLIEVHK